MYKGFLFTLILTVIITATACESTYKNKFTITEIREYQKKCSAEVHIFSSKKYIQIKDSKSLWIDIPCRKFAPGDTLTLTKM